MDEDIEARAEWTGAYINSLPDSAFAVVLAGGEKDGEGKTVPRDLRKLPHHAQGGALDGPHVRNGLSREPQSDMPASAHERARTHLQAHLADLARSEDEIAGATRSVELEAVVEVRDEAKREIDVRLLPWGKQIETVLGPEKFGRGAFLDANPADVYLYGVEHEIRLGLGQDGQAKAVRVPVGRGKALSDEADGPHATFRVAQTAGGDESLALARDGIVTGVSVEFAQVPGGTSIENRDGRRVRVHNRARLLGATLTHRPAYGEEAAVLAVRNKEDQVVDTVTAPEPEQAPAAESDAQLGEAMARAIATIQGRSEAVNEKFLDRLEKLEEQARSAIQIPAGVVPEKDKPTIGQWAHMVLRILSGERVSEKEYRTIDDVVTTDNAGVVPPTFLTELIGVIDASRPFLSTTRRLPTPPSGMTITVPIITQRPEVGVQSTEKTELASRLTKISTKDFSAITIGGVGDLSLQLIKRSSPSFLTLWIELLAEAYAQESENQALKALFEEIGGVGGAGPLDPDNLNLGDAYVASFDAIRKPPDTIWLSTQAVGEFIDAKASTTNQPLYSNITASATAAGGISGTISGLRAVHVPTLDAHGSYALVGPSAGFAWAEDGTYTLQVDVPAKAGRDVALVGMLFPAPWYPAAFTAYNVAS